MELERQDEEMIARGETIPKTVGLQELMRDPFIERKEGDMQVDAAEDPVRNAVEWGIRKLQDVFGKLPERASPIANALDVEYRDKLNERIETLSYQVKDLERKLLQKK
jgi:polyhydroxyalkanoate synthesis regulator phasin